jgi:translation initiation factor IF-3
MVIDETGAALGQMPTEQALALAQSKGLDLVEIAPMARPPVCKILDFKAFTFQQEKLLRKSKANQKRVELKGIRLTFRMGDHDREVRLRQSRAFLDDGHKVQLEMRLRGRENALAEHGRKVMVEFMQLLGPDIVAEQPLGRMGNRFTTILGKKK